MSRITEPNTEFVNNWIESRLKKKDDSRLFKWTCGNCNGEGEIKPKIPAPINGVCFLCNGTGRLDIRNFDPDDEEGGDDWAIDLWMDFAEKEFWKIHEEETNELKTQLHHEHHYHQTQLPLKDRAGANDSDPVRI